MELILTGDIISAEAASAIGLVQRVVPQETLMDEAMALAEKIAANAPIAVQNAKKAIWEGLESADMDDAILIEADYFGQCFATEDQKGGMEAFLEKKKPVFAGR